MARALSDKSQILISLARALSDMSTKLFQSGKSFIGKVYKFDTVWLELYLKSLQCCFSLVTTLSDKCIMLFVFGKNFKAYKMDSFWQEFFLTNLQSYFRFVRALKKKSAKLFQLGKSFIGQVS